MPLPLNTDIGIKIIDISEKESMKKENRAAEQQNGNEEDFVC